MRPRALVGRRPTAVAFGPMRNTIVSFAFVVVLTSLFSAACHKSSAPAPAAPTAATGAGGGGTAPEGAACQHTTCGACVSESGCWWHTDTHACTFEMQGCTEGTNCVNNVAYPCPQ